MFDHVATECQKQAKKKLNFHHFKKEGAEDELKSCLEKVQQVSWPSVNIYNTLSSSLRGMTPQHVQIFLKQIVETRKTSSRNQLMRKFSINHFYRICLIVLSESHVLNAFCLNEPMMI